MYIFKERIDNHAHSTIHSIIDLKDCYKKTTFNQSIITNIDIEINQLEIDIIRIKKFLLKIIN